MADHATLSANPGDDEDRLTQSILALASQYGRFGYRRITALLKTAGWKVGKDRVQRIWRREGLKVPQKQRPRGRLWLNDGSCVRLRPEHANHVWSYDFVSAMTHDGRTLRLLVVIEEYTRECLAIRVARRLGSNEVIETLAELIGDTPKVAFDHYGREWGQHYQEPLWAAIGVGPKTRPKKASTKRGPSKSSRRKTAK